jgi:hypothetical protein
MQRFELQDGGEFFHAPQLLPDDVGGDFGGQRERKSHNFAVSYSDSWQGAIAE